MRGLQSRTTVEYNKVIAARGNIQNYQEEVNMLDYLNTTHASAPDLNLIRTRSCDCGKDS